MAKTSSKKTASHATESFAAQYPNLADLVENQGWVEIGYNDWSRSFMRVLDVGGMVWEGEQSYASVDAALRATEIAIVEWTGKDVTTQKRKR